MDYFIQCLVNMLTSKIYWNQQPQISYVGSSEGFGNQDREIKEENWGNRKPETHRALCSQQTPVGVERQAERQNITEINKSQLPWPTDNQS